MKMLLLDVQGNEIKVVEANTLEEYYELLKCDVIDIVRRKIGGVTAQVICDDEGLLRDRPKVSALNSHGEPMLCGNLLIAGGEVVDGELTSLTNEEINMVLKNIVIIKTKNYPEPYRVFAGMEF